jgi:hypothetical protein
LKFFRGKTTDSGGFFAGRLPIAGGNLDYFTDGCFIWPVYYPYYLAKYPNFIISEKLYSYASSHNFVIEKLSPQVVRKLERKFDLEWTGKYEDE